MAANISNYTSGSFAATTSGSFSHTPNFGATMLLLGLSVEFSSADWACTWGGAAPTNYRGYDTDASGETIAIWWQKNPGNSAKTAAWTWTTSRYAAGWAIALTGARTDANPLVTTALGTNASPLVNANCSVGDTIVDFVHTNDPYAPTVPNPGQTLIGAIWRGAVSYRTATTSPQPIGWTLDGDDGWVAFTVAVRPLLAGSQVIFAMFKRWQDLYWRLRQGLPLPEWYLRRGMVPGWIAAYKEAVRSAYAA
jgi:hypothetical protein